MLILCSAQVYVLFALCVLSIRWAGNYSQLHHVLVHVGDRGFNYANNLDWMKHLRKLDIQHESLIVAGAEHSALQIYEKVGKRIMLFHATHFKRPVKGH